MYTFYIGLIIYLSTFFHLLKKGGAQNQPLRKVESTLKSKCFADTFLKVAFLFYIQNMV